MTEYLKDCVSKIFVIIYLDIWKIMTPANELSEYRPE